MAVNEESKKAAATASVKAAPARGTKLRRTEEEDAVYTGTPLSMAGIRGLLGKSVVWKIVMGLLVFIFAVGFAFNAFTPRQGPDGSGIGPSRVATVGNQTVERDRWMFATQRQMDYMTQFGMKTDTMGLLSSYQRTLDDLISDAAQYDTAVEQNLLPTSKEMDAEIAKQIKDATKAPEGTTETAFRRQVEARFGSMEKYEQQVREEIEKNREGIEHKLAVDKLKKSVEDKNTTSEADYKKSVTKLDLYLISIRPKPETIKPGTDPKTSQEKGKADAKARAEKLTETLKNADLAAFKAAAQKESDDQATKSKGGSMGWTMPSTAPVPQTVKDALQNATGKLVGPIEDEYSSGFSIFYINGRKEELPKDYAKKKAELLKSYETQKDNEVWSKYLEDLKKTKEPEILDPAMQALKIQNEKIFSAPVDQQKTLRQEALDKYQEALGHAPRDLAAAIRYQMAQIYRQDNQTEKALAALQEAVKDSNDASLQIQLANTLHDTKRDKEALAELKKVSEQLDKNPSTPSQFGGNPDDNLRMQIAAAYQAMNKKDLADAERKKIKPQAPGGMGGMGGMGNMPFTIKPQ